MGKEEIEIDPELIALLDEVPDVSIDNWEEDQELPGNQLESTDVPKDVPKDELSDVPQDVPKQPKDKLSDVPQDVPKQPKDKPILLEPVIEGQVSKLSSSKLQEQPEADKVDLGIKELLLKFSSTVDQIILNQAQDREQLEQAISYLDNEIKVTRQSGAKLSPSIVEAWAKLLQAKTEVNSNASKVLDSVAKLLSAGRGNELIVNLGVKGVKEIDLEALLSQPKYDDEFLGN